MWGLTVSDIITDEKQISSEEVVYFKNRSPIKPITIDLLTEIDRVAPKM
jgi:hypothetical protein